jgi:hypothetical protein
MKIKNIIKENQPVFENIKIEEHKIKVCKIMMIIKEIGWLEKKNMDLSKIDEKRRIKLIQEIVYKNLGFGSLR